ncbi:hypothetical protein [Citrobacter sp. CRE-46]|uniref:hypothetical protein n=1 Tax=Citrobacter TaxID=544 RepID=UPI0019550FAB|nr:hypothetical protein [Citrobacter sp. CRE-46]
MRYQVFKTKEGGLPVFTAPWYWLASAIAHWSSLNWDACRIVDSKADKTMLCWAKALPAAKKFRCQAFFENSLMAGSLYGARV